MRVRLAVTMILCLCAIPSFAAAPILWKADFQAAKDARKASDLAAAIKFLKKALPECDPGSREHADTLNELASVMIETGDTDAEELYVKQALDELEKLYGKDSPELLPALINNAAMQNSTNHPTEAQAAFEHANSIIEKSKQSKQAKQAKIRESILRYHRGLAEFQAAQGKYPEAKASAELALRLSKSSEEKADALDAQGTVYYRAHEWASAAETFRKELSMRLKTKAPDLKIAICKGSLGVSLNAIGENKEAHTQLEEAYQLYEKALPPDSPKMMLPLNNLALACKEVGKYDGAERCYTKALQLASALHCENTSDTATILCNLGQTLLAASKLEQAEATLLKALAMKESSVGNQHADYAWVETHLSDCYLTQKKFAQCEPLLLNAIKTNEKKFGAESESVNRILRRLINLYLQMERWDEAIPPARTLIANQEKMHGKDSVQVADDLRLLIRAQVEKRQIDDARNSLDRVVAIEKKLGTSVNLGDALYQLGTFFRSLEKYDDAERVLKEAVAVYEGIPKPENERINTAMRDLAEVHLSLNKPELAASLLEKLVTRDEKFKPDDLEALSNDLHRLSVAYRDSQRTSEEKQLGLRVLSLDEKIRRMHANTTGGVPPAKADSGTGENAQLPAAVFKNKWAVVVGISAYQDPALALKWASKDARDFSEYLIKEAGFSALNVKVLTDTQATRSEIVSALGDGWLGRRAQPGDLAVVYIVANGIKSDQKSEAKHMVLPYDGTEKNALATGIPTEWLTKLIADQVPCKRTVIVLDLNHAAGGEKGIARAAEFDPSSLTVSPGQMLICSSKPNQNSWDSKSCSNSVFLHHLLDGLRSKAGNTSLKEAFDYMQTKVQDEVRSDRNEQQQPFLVHTPKEPISLAAPAAAETANPGRVSDNDTHLFDDVGP